MNSESDCKELSGILKWVIGSNARTLSAAFTKFNTNGIIPKLRCQPFWIGFKNTVKFVIITKIY